MDNLAKIGIDFGSMLIYLVNYGLLLFALGYFVYPKIIKIIDERRQTINDNLSQAAMLRNDMSKQMESHKEDRQKLLLELEEDRIQLKQELQEKRTELIAKMEAERAKLIEEAKGQMEKEKKEIVVKAEKEITQMVERVIMKILSNQVPEDVVKKSVHEAWNLQK